MKYEVVLLTTDTPGHRQVIDKLGDGVTPRFWPNVHNINAHTRVVTLGTPILPKSLIANGADWFNLHGGNPEYYRGLDSHWWAIYHRDWDNIVTTLHWIDIGVDTGDICLQSAVPLKQDLYRSNMEVCAALINMTLNLTVLPRRKQVKKGRYYSSIPEELKEVCRERLRKQIGG